MIDLHKMGQEAKTATLSMATAATPKKNLALETVAKLLKKHESEILETNNVDKQTAQGAGLSDAMIDRLSLDGRLGCLRDDINTIISLPDPIGEEFDRSTLENGLQICRRRTPIGVLGVIYESRPNVTLDTASLLIKTGNCAILRGGSETLRTNKFLVKLIQEALEIADLPPHAIQLITDSSRDHVKTLLSMHETVDLIIPRGGASLHQFCRDNGKIPVITGGIGVCHLFVDESANLQKALEVIFNAKTQRPTVCNALDTLIIHDKIAKAFIPLVIEKLGEAGVEFHVDENAEFITRELSNRKDNKIRQSQLQDWDTEWLSLVLGISIVPGIDEAISHIRAHSTGHSDGIITEDILHKEKFLNSVDSAAVYINASTRFTDGSQLGLGAEAAISTQKLHARGPMGLKELTSYKWIIQGDYHVRR